MNDEGGELGFIAGSGLVALVLLVLFLFVVKPERAEGHSNPWLLSWIPGYCCVTNDCCFEITERDAQSLPNDLFRIAASGQVLRRTGNTPDGKWYRCACDWNGEKWIVHPTAFTRCIFTPDFGS